MHIDAYMIDVAYMERRLLEAKSLVVLVEVARMVVHQGFCDVRRRRASI